jgi:hypothetical protein
MSESDSSARPDGRPSAADDRPSAAGPEGIDAVPGLARLAASAWWHTTGWAVQTSLRTSRRVMEAAVSPTKAVGLALDARDSLRDALRDLAAMGDVEGRVPGARSASDVAKRVSDIVPMPKLGSIRESGPADGRGRDGNSAEPHRSLRAQGEVLLRKSRDVRYEADAHPAYERILSELAPDEGRILRLMLIDGPQPAVDVRTGGPIGILRSRLVAPGLSMIGARAGCRYGERVPSYLNNLFRLGLVWFSRETLPDPLRYQVLEAQPDVVAAIHSVRQAKVVRRSVHLTPFGEDFCRVCLSPDSTALGPLPAHSWPPEAAKMPQPPAELIDD